MYQYFPNHNAVFAGTHAYRWHFDAGGKINGGLAVVGDTLYAETFARQLLAIDRRTGRVRWRTHLPNIAMTTPIVADGLVIVGTGKDNTLLQTRTRLVWGIPGGDEIIAFDADTGRVRWRYHTVGEDMPSPAFVTAGGRDLIIFANGDGHIRALDVRTGRLVFSRYVGGVSTMASAAVADGVVYVLLGFAAGMHLPDHVYAVRASDGHIVWSAPYGNADDSPTVGGVDVYVQDSQYVKGPPAVGAINDVYAISRDRGLLVWARNAGAGYFTNVGTNEQAIAAMLDRDTLFQSLPAARKFAAYEAGQGRPVWVVPTMTAAKMSAVALDGRVYIGDTAGILYTFDEGSGRVLSRRRFPKPFTCSSPVIVGKTLYVADWNDVYALPLR